MELGFLFPLSDAYFLIHYVLSPFTPFRDCGGLYCPYFIRYQGFQTTHVAPSPTPNAQGQKIKMAQVLFDSPDLASVAKEALDGFTLKKGWVMSVAYI